MSWVLLTPDRAYKLKKPVHFGFLDLREPAARRRACRQEVEVNQALAARIVLGVRAVVPVEGGLALAPEGAPDAIDWVVEMVRFDEERTMAAAIRRDALRDEDVVATARTIQRFHADAGRPPVRRWSQQVADAWQANLDELADAAGAALTPARTDAWRRFASGFLRRRADRTGRAGENRAGGGRARRPARGARRARQRGRHGRRSPRVRRAPAVRRRRRRPRVPRHGSAQARGRPGSRGPRDGVPRRRW